MMKVNDLTPKSTIPGWHLDDGFRIPDPPPQPAFALMRRIGDSSAGEKSGAPDNYRDRRGVSGARPSDLRRDAYVQTCFFRRDAGADDALP